MVAGSCTLVQLALRMSRKLPGTKVSKCVVAEPRATLMVAVLAAKVKTEVGIEDAPTAPNGRDLGDTEGAIDKQNLSIIIGGRSYSRTLTPSVLTKGGACLRWEGR